MCAANLPQLTFHTFFCAIQAWHYTYPATLLPCISLPHPLPWACEHTPAPDFSPACIPACEAYIPKTCLQQHAQDRTTNTPYTCRARRHTYLMEREDKHKQTGSGSVLIVHVFETVTKTPFSQETGRVGWQNAHACLANLYYLPAMPFPPHSPLAPTWQPFVSPSARLALPYLCFLAAALASLSYYLHALPHICLTFTFCLPFALPEMKNSDKQWWWWWWRCQ